jgi:hypothetical protein
MIHHLQKLFPFLRKKVIFTDNLRTEPISEIFGLERGTPIDRYYIQQFLSRHASLVKGTVLEIAENTYSKQYAAPNTTFEILHYDKNASNATIIGDLTEEATLPANKIDCFICTQTLNFIFDVQKAIQGSYKLLKNEGVFLGTVSGISQISRYDMDRWGDYWRFTDLSIKKLFEQTFGEGNIQVETFGNVMSATAFLQGVAVEDIPNKALLDIQDANYQLTIGIKAIKNL